MESEPWLLVGLGNPGLRYRAHRHNAGVMVLERVAASAGMMLGREKFKAIYGTGEVGGERVIVLLPQTYMNRSGESVGRAVAFWKIPVERVLVVHDDIDLPVGVVRVKRDGGHGGHNGLRSLHQVLGGGDYPRIRVGVGRPVHGTVEDYVLTQFRADEQAEIEAALERAAEAVVSVLNKGVTRAANEVNGVRPLRERSEVDEETE